MKLSDLPQVIDLVKVLNELNNFEHHAVKAHRLWAVACQPQRNIEEGVSIELGGSEVGRIIRERRDDVHAKLKELGVDVDG